MRLRQACCHPQLVKQTGARKAEEIVTPEAQEAAARLTNDQRVSLLKLLAEPERYSCVHCDDIPDDPVASVCGHLFCRCVELLLSAIPKTSASFLAEISVSSSQKLFIFII